MGRFILLSLEKDFGKKGMGRALFKQSEGCSKPGDSVFIGCFLGDTSLPYTKLSCFSILENKDNNNIYLR